LIQGVGQKTIHVAPELLTYANIETIGFTIKGPYPLIFGVVDTESKTNFSIEHPGLTEVNLKTLRSRTRVDRHRQTLTITDITIAREKTSDTLLAVTPVEIALFVLDLTKNIFLKEMPIPLRDPQVPKSFYESYKCFLLAELSYTQRHFPMKLILFAKE
jgi:hypothetical protein